MDNINKSLETPDLDSISLKKNSHETKQPKPGTLKAVYPGTYIQGENALDD